MMNKADDVTMALVGEDMARKKTGARGRRPGRPKTGDSGGDVAPGERPVLYVTLESELWNRLTRSLERARAKTGFTNLTRADLVRSLLDRAMKAEESEAGSAERK